MTSKSLKRVSYLILVGPTFLVFALVVVFPVVASLALSFTKWAAYGAPKFIGITNYVHMFTDSGFYARHESIIAPALRDRSHVDSD